MTDLEDDVARLAARIADVVEANGIHPQDDGFCAALDANGVTAAGKRRLIEKMRERAACVLLPEGGR